MACLIFSMDICFLPCVLVCFFLFPRPFCLVSLGQYYFSKSKAHADDALVIKGYHLKCSVSGSLRRHFAFDLPHYPATGLPLDPWRAGSQWKPEGEGFFSFFSFWPHYAPCGILVSWPGIDLTPSVVEVQSPNHWNTREVPLRLKFWGRSRELRALRYPVRSDREWRPWWSRSRVAKGHWKGPLLPPGTFKISTVNVASMHYSGLIKISFRLL